MTQEAKFEWDKLSIPNLKVSQKVIGVVVNYLQFQTSNKYPFYHKILLQKFANEQTTFDDIKYVFGKISGITIGNAEKTFEVERDWELLNLTTYGMVSAIPFKKENEKKEYEARKEELKNYVFFQIESTDDLYRVKNLIDKLLRSTVKIKKVSKSKVKLKSVEIKFDDDKAIIKIGNQDCQLPPFKNEHSFCRAMFQFPIKEFADWSIIYEKYEGKESNDPKKNKRTIQDAMYAVNKRIKGVINTSDDLFTWEEKSIKRNY